MRPSVGLGQEPVVLCQWFSAKTSALAAVLVCRASLYTLVVQLCVGSHGQYHLPEDGPMGSSQEPAARDLQQVAEMMK